MSSLAPSKPEAAAKRTVTVTASSSTGDASKGSGVPRRALRSALLASSSQLASLGATSSSSSAAAAGHPPSGADDSEDQCAYCSLGGEVIICDVAGCTKVYHYRCLGLASPPLGDEAFVCPGHRCCICGVMDASLPEAQQAFLATGDAAADLLNHNSAAAKPPNSIATAPLTRCACCPSAYCGRCKPDTAAYTSRLSGHLAKPVLADDALSKLLTVPRAPAASADSAATALIATLPPVMTDVVVTGDGASSGGAAVHAATSAAVASSSGINDERNSDASARPSDSPCDIEMMQGNGRSAEPAVDFTDIGINISREATGPDSSSSSAPAALLETGHMPDEPDGSLESTMASASSGGFNLAEEPADEGAAGGGSAPASAFAVDETDSSAALRGRGSRKRSRPTAAASSTGRSKKLKTGSKGADDGRSSDSSSSGLGSDSSESDSSDGDDDEAPGPLITVIPQPAAPAATRRTTRSSASNSAANSAANSRSQSPSPPEGGTSTCSEGSSKSGGGGALAVSTAAADAQTPGHSSSGIGSAGSISAGGGGRRNMRRGASSLVSPDATSGSAAGGSGSGSGSSRRVTFTGDDVTVTATAMTSPPPPFQSQSGSSVMDASASSLESVNPSSMLGGSAERAQRRRKEPERLGTVVPSSVIGSRSAGSNSQRASPEGDKDKHKEKGDKSNSSKGDDKDKPPAGAGAGSAKKADAKGGARAKVAAAAAKAAVAPLTAAVLTENEAESAAEEAEDEASAAGEGAAMTVAAPASSGKGGWQCPNCACPTAATQLAKLLEQIWSFVANQKLPHVIDAVLSPVPDVSALPVYLAAGYSPQQLGLTRHQAEAVRRLPMPLQSSSALEAPVASVTTSYSDATMREATSSSAGTQVIATSLPPELASLSNATDAFHMRALLSPAAASAPGPSELSLLPHTPACLHAILASIRAHKYRSSKGFLADLEAFEGAVKRVSGSRNGSADVMAGPYPSFLGSKEEEGVLGVGITAATGGSMASVDASAAASLPTGDIASRAVPANRDSAYERFFLCAQTVVQRLRAAAAGKKYLAQLQHLNALNAAIAPSTGEVVMADFSPAVATIPVPPASSQAASAAVPSENITDVIGSLGLSPSEAAARVQAARRSCVHPELSLTHRPYNRCGDKRSIEARVAAVGDVVCPPKPGGKTVLAESVQRAVTQRRKPIITGFGPNSRRYETAELYEQANIAANAAAAAAAAATSSAASGEAEEGHHGDVSASGVIPADASGESGAGPMTVDAEESDGDSQVSGPGPHHYRSSGPPLGALSDAGSALAKATTQSVLMRWPTQRNFEVSFARFAARELPPVISAASSAAAAASSSAGPEGTAAGTGAPAPAATAPKIPADTVAKFESAVEWSRHALAAVRAAGSSSRSTSPAAGRIGTAANEEGSGYGGGGSSSSASPPDDKKRKHGIASSGGSSSSGAETSAVVKQLASLLATFQPSGAGANASSSASGTALSAPTDDRWTPLMQKLLQDRKAADCSLSSLSSDPLDSLLSALSAAVGSPATASSAHDTASSAAPAALSGEAASEATAAAAVASDQQMTDAAVSVEAQNRSANAAASSSLPATAPASGAAAATDSSSKEALLLATVMHLARRLDSTQAQVAAFQSAAQLQMQALQLGVSGILSALGSLSGGAGAGGGASSSAFRRPDDRPSFLPVNPLRPGGPASSSANAAAAPSLGGPPSSGIAGSSGGAQLAPPDGADGTSYSSFSALEGDANVTGTGAYRPPSPASFRQSLISMNRSERDALLTLTELAPSDVDGGVEHLRELLPPSSHEVTGLLEDTSSHMRRALRGLAELRAAWVASRRSLFSVPAPYGVEAKLVIPVGLAAALGQQPQWVPVYDGSDAITAAASEPSGFAAGGSGSDVMDIDEYALAQQQRAAISGTGADADASGVTASLSSSSEAASAVRDGVRYGYTGTAGGDTGLPAGAVDGSASSGLGGSGMITVGEGRYALEVAVANASLRAQVRALEAAVAARDTELAALRRAK